MTYNHLNVSYIFSPKKALAFGFVLQNGAFVFKEDAGGGLMLTLSLREDGDEALLTVRDAEFGEDYPLFEQESAGTFAAGLREKAETLWMRVLYACYTDRRMRPRLLAYLAGKFGTQPDAPFAEDNITLALRCPNGKWFGLLMRIPFSRLHAERKELVDVLNIKLPPEKIPSLIDDVHFFRCYHMNRTHWISIALTETLDWDKLTSLVCESYALVADNRKK